MSKQSFTKSLIKGKIAETIFEHMLLESGAFTVIHFGYEYKLPELLKSNEADKNSEIAQAIRTAPDFAVINRETKLVHLIEVKYKARMSKSYVLDDAIKMSKSWNPSYIFLATRQGFFFDEISKIIENKGVISPLVHKKIPKKLQEKYLDILRDCEPS